jgi:hypothetical protein
MTKFAGSGSKSGSISQRHGSADSDPDPPQMSWICNTASYLFLGGLRITGGVDMLPTHGALHHVPLGRVAVGPPTARARQALQTEMCCRQVAEISVK